MAMAIIEYANLVLEVTYTFYAADDGGMEYPSSPAYVELESVFVDGTDVCLDFLLTDEQNAEIRELVEKEVL